MTDDAKIVKDERINALQETLERIRCANPQDEVAVVEAGIRGVYRPTFSVLAEEAATALTALETELATAKAELERAREEERERIIALLEVIGFLNVRAALAPEEKG